MKVTIVVQTSRKEPMLEWIASDLVAQSIVGDDIELLVIDFFGRSLAYLNPIFEPIDHRFNWHSKQPRPNIWQGQYRVTDCDWWATATTRNTALCIAKHDYVCFLDDRSHLGPEWLATLRRYASSRDAVLAGSYVKLQNDRPPARDHRMERYPEGLNNCGGGWLYGCCFALPLEWALEVNGFEEGCEGVAGEDYMFGLMLENNGRRVDFRPEFFVTQERSTHTEHGFKQLDKGVAPNDKSHAALGRFRKRKRTEFTPDLRELRARLWAGEPFPIPDPNATYLDWFDGSIINGSK